MEESTNITFVYIICHQVDGKFTSPSKIGVSKHPKSRLSSLNSGSPVKLALFHQFGVPDEDCAYGLEKAILLVHKDKRMNGEWLDMEPAKLFHSMVLNINAMLDSLGFEGREHVERAAYTIFVAGSGNGGSNLPKNIEEGV